MFSYPAVNWTKRLLRSCFAETKRQTINGFDYFESINKNGRNALITNAIASAEECIHWEFCIKFLAGIANPPHIKRA